MVFSWRVRQSVLLTSVSRTLWKQNSPDILMSLLMLVQTFFDDCDAFDKLCNLFKSGP